MTSYYVAQAFVEGPRKEIVGMLNTILRNVGGGDIITDSDDLETINSKFRCL